MPSRRKEKKDPNEKKKKCPPPKKKIQTNNKTKFGEQNRDQRAGTEKLHVSTKKIKASGSKIIEEIEKNV